MYDTLAVIIASDLQRNMLHAQLHLLAGFVSTNSFQKGTFPYSRHRTVTTSEHTCMVLAIAVQYFGS